MASATTTTEKVAQHTHDERHVDQHQDLEKVATLDDIDVANHAAFKGDDSDGKIDFNFMQVMAALFLALLYTGSQILLYLVGGALAYVIEGLHTSAATGWMPVANTLAISAVAPFVGYLQDLFGKRWIAMFGCVTLIVGCVLVGSAKSFGQAVAGMAVAGAGAAVGELTGLAGLSETVPVKYRGYSLGLLVAFVLPWTPYNVYAQLYSTQTALGWRWGPYICAIFNGVTLIGLFVFYHPHQHPRAEGFSYMSILKRIDFIGGITSIVGLTIFLVALQAGGYTHAWKSAYVLCQLLIGIALLAFWFVWEWKFAKHPMIPHEIFQGQRVVAGAFLFIFIGGFNYLLLVFWPLVVTYVYPGANGVRQGLRGLPIVLSVTFGGVVWNMIISARKGSAKWVLFSGSVLMTAFAGAMACMTPDNCTTVMVLSGFLGFSLGSVLIPPITTAMIGAPDAVISTVAALALSLRAVGGSIGYSIYFNVWQSKLIKALPTYVALYAVEAGLPVADVPVFLETLLESPTKILTVPGVTLEILEAATIGERFAYAHAFTYIWYTSIAFGCLAILASLVVPNTRRYETNRVAIKM